MENLIKPSRKIAGLLETKTHLSMAGTRIPLAISNMLFTLFQTAFWDSYFPLTPLPIYCKNSLAI